MDGELKAAVEAAVGDLQDAFAEGVEDVVTTAVTNLRDACNNFLAQAAGDEAPEAEAPEAVPEA